MNNPEPNPVPSVITSSTPCPAIAPKPCTSASLATRTGLPSFFDKVSARGKPPHLPFRFGAVTVTPRRTTPGKPTDTRSNSPCCFASSTMALITAAGVAGLGVFTRMRSVRSLPVSLSTTALIPVPPMSMARVRNE